MQETWLRAGLLFFLGIWVIGSSMYNLSYANNAGERMQRQAEGNNHAPQVEPADPSPSAPSEQKEGAETEDNPETETHPKEKSQRESASSTPEPARAAQKQEEEKSRKHPAPLVIYHGPKQEKKVALTFDDGPDPVYTPKILDILRKKKVPGTFFVVGREVKAYPEITVQIAAEGHVLANHTWNHAYLPDLKKKEVKEELVRTAQVVEKLTGREMELMRPPYGAVAGQEKEVAHNGYRMINWDVDSLDWKGRRTPAQILQTVKSQVQPGSIILLHSGGGNRSATVKTLPLLIDQLQAKGYSFVTVDELIGVPAYRSE